MKDPQKYVMTADVPLDEGVDSLDVDVEVEELASLEGTLPTIFTEMRRQWSHSSRIGTVYLYFDHAGILHLHFMERGPYLTRSGALKEAPVGHLPAFAVFPAANEAESMPLAAAHLLVTMPSSVDVKDPRWSDIVVLLKQMHEADRGT